MAAHQLARFCEILGALHETQRNPVAALFDREAQVAPVLLRQGGYGNDHIGHVNALAVRQGAADLDHRLDPVIGHILHAQHQLAIVEQKPGFRHQRRVNFRVRQVHPPCVARRFVAVEYEGCTHLQNGKAALERTDAQLGSLQVAQYGRRPPEFLFQRPDDRDARRMILMRSMAHVDAESVRPGDKKRADHFRRVARGAKGRQNPDLARTGRQFRHSQKAPGRHGRALACQSAVFDYPYCTTG